MNTDYHFQSFKEAFSGLQHAFSEHPNFRIHLCLSIFVLLLAWFYKVTGYDLIFLILIIILGFVVEFLNTAIESICDLVTLEWRKDIEIAKDLAAAMMLVTAVGSILVALLIFYPYIFSSYIK